MFLFKISVFALFCSSAVVMANFSTLDDKPLCVRVDDPFTIEGEATFVDVDGSGGAPTIGDMSIAPVLMPGANPFTPSLVVTSFETEAICVITSEDVAAPACFLETKLRICRKRRQSNNFRPDCSATYEGTITAHGTGPEPFSVTGGNGDFFGAFGWIDGESSTAPTPPMLEFGITFNICFYPNMD